MTAESSPLPISSARGMLGQIFALGNEPVSAAKEVKSVEAAVSLPVESQPTISEQLYSIIYEGVETPLRIKVPSSILDAKKRGDWTWQKNAACNDADPDLFESSGAKPAIAEAAKAYCGRCAVQDSCIVFTIKDEDGITANMTKSERKQLRKGKQDLYEFVKDV